MELLIVVDMQKDFIDGALGTPEAQAIVPAVRSRIQQCRLAGGRVIFTRDTHGPDYLQTQEGRLLPVVHCVKGTPGWQLDERLEVADAPVVDKPSFGSMELVDLARQLAPEEITLVGLCTDVCVISNALLLKAGLPETPVRVDAACCAGVTPASHQNALTAMEACQVLVVHKEENQDDI